VLRVAAAPEIAPALEDLAQHAEQTEAALQCADIQVAATPPADVREALSRGWAEESDGPPPHVWVPTTSIEVGLTSESSAAGDMFSEDNPSIAGSPTVIAMPQPMANALGWPDFDMSWNAVAKMTAADNAWAERGDEAWGPFKLSFVNGVDSQPSMDGVAALTRAVGVLPADPPASEETSTAQSEARAQLLLLERKVQYLGDGTQEQLARLREADDNGDLLLTVSALPLTEQQVWQYNRGGPEGGDEPSTPLVAWYPEDGGPDADYPYATLNASWSDQSTGLAAGALLDVLQSAEGQERLQQAGFRDASRQAAPALGDDGTIQPDRVPPEPEPFEVAAMQPVLQAWRGLSQTGNILGVLDVSGSMATEIPGTGKSRLELSIEGAIAGVQVFDPQTISGTWEFSTDIGPNGEDYREVLPLVPLDGEVNGVPAKEAAVAALSRLRPREDTGLHDTIAAAYEHMLDNYKPDRINAVIVFTDGRNDDDDGLNLEQLQTRLRELVDPKRRVLVLAVGYGSEANVEALNAITAITDGKIYALERPEDIRNVFIDVQTGGVR
jgi:Ca-activated chloride channel family protein